MSKQTIEIEVLPGWRLVERRKITPGEFFLDGHGEIKKATGSPKGVFLIVVPQNEMPAYLRRTLSGVLKPGTWIAKDRSQRWFNFSKAPSLRENVWQSSVGGMTADLNELLFDIKWPDCDWDKSLMMVWEDDGRDELVKAAWAVVSIHSVSGVGDSPAIDRLRGALE